jgi:hypothetical protein
MPDAQVDTVREVDTGYPAEAQSFRLSVADPRRASDLVPVVAPGTADRPEYGHGAPIRVMWVTKQGLVA